jgi:hypothetical protein
LHGPRLVSMEDHWSAGELGRQGRTSEQGESGGLVGEDGQLNVQRLMEEQERVISALDPKLRRAQVWRAF